MQVAYVSNVHGLSSLSMVAGVVIDQRCIMRCILSSLDRAGSSASEKERLQEIQVLEVEGRSVQVRARLSEELVLFGL